MGVVRRLSVAAGLLLTLAGPASCGLASGPSSGSSSPPSTSQPQALDADADLYRPADPIPDGPAGTLLWYQDLPAGLPDARAWRILYLFRPVDGEPQAVSGMVVVPTGGPPRSGFPVVGWAHPTDGVADRCAPSKDGPATVIGVRALFGDGFVVAATDYEGLGTPGTHPYLDGVSAGRTLIDAVRAASQLPQTPTSDQTLFWGYSQGGQAALFAAQEVATYAPELEVAGTVAAAPAANLRRLAGGDDGRPPLPGLALMMIGSWALDRSLEPGSILDDAAAALVPRLEETCDPKRLIADLSGPLVFDPPATRQAPWDDLIDRSTPGSSRSEGPVLLVQGGRDRLLDPASTARLFRSMCQTGSTVELRRFPGQGHGVALRAADQITRWLAHRRDGLAAADECAP